MRVEGLKKISDVEFRAWCGLSERVWGLALVWICWESVALSSSTLLDMNSKTVDLKGARSTGAATLEWKSEDCGFEMEMRDGNM